MNIFVQNLALYNKGIIRGSWFKLGDTEENLQTFLKEKVGIDEEHPSSFIADYEQEDLCYCPTEFTDIINLNQLACLFYEFGQDEQDKVNAIMEAGIYDLETAMNDIDKYVLYTEIQTEEDFGHFLVEELETCAVPDTLKLYIDYERLGRDESINSSGSFTMFGYLEEA